MLLFCITWVTNLSNLSNLSHSLNLSCLKFAGVLLVSLVLLVSVRLSCLSRLYHFIEEDSEKRARLSTTFTLFVFVKTTYLFSRKIRSCSSLSFYRRRVEEKWRTFDGKSRRRFEQDRF